MTTALTTAAHNVPPLFILTAEIDALFGQRKPEFRTEPVETLLWNDLEWIDLSSHGQSVRIGDVSIELPFGLVPTNFVVAPNGDCIRTYNSPQLAIQVTERSGEFEVGYKPPFGRELTFKFSQEVGAICCLEELRKKFFRAAKRLHKQRSLLTP
jgi:hypothetical protein